MRFKTSQVYESALVPIILGLFVGFIAAIMGVGGAFLMVPAMIYLIGMPTKLVPGTSLFVTIFITGFVVVLHAFTYNTIDFGSCFNFNYRIDSWGTLGTKSRAKTARF